MHSTQLEIEGLPSGLMAAHEYWVSLKGDRVAPSWKEFDLLNLPLQLVPTTLVIDIKNPVSNSVYRFWGSKMTEIHGVDMTKGSPYNLEPKEFGQQVYKDHCATIEKKRPTAGHYSFFAHGGYIHSHSLLRLPLSDDNDKITQLIVVIDYSSEALNLIKKDRTQFNLIARQILERGAT